LTSKVTLAREFAYDTFTKVIEQGKCPDLLLEEAYRAPNGLNRLDRAFIKELLFGTLRWYSKIFWIVQNTSKRDLKTSSPEIRSALVLGAYQIFYMDRVPDRAAVNESVEYVRKKGQAAGSGFVNGILRSIARRAEYFAKPDKDKNPSEYLSLQYAHPQWIVQRWSKSFNFDKMREILSSNNQVPPYTIRVNSSKVAAEALPEFRSLLLKDEKNHSERRALRSCLHLRDAPHFEEGTLFQRGFYTIQDESSQLIAHLVDPKANELVIDACAGKGGKTGHLYELANGEITLIALDKKEDQLKLARESMQRLGHEKITFLQSDFLEYKPTEAPDKILLDAPCSGLGVLRRHPEGKWQKTLAIIPTLARQQRALLQHGFEMLKKGGEIVYSVCSFETEEVLDHLDWVCKHYGKQVELISPISRLPDYYKRFVTRENVLLVYSGNKDAMDGFGAFILRKV